MASITDNDDFLCVVSDSDDDFYTAQLSKIITRRPTENESSSGKREQRDHPRKRVNRLDDLLSDHNTESAERERLEKVKKELLQDLEKDSQDDVQSCSQSLASEHEQYLQQRVVTSSLKQVQPGITLFNEDKYGCCFSSHVCPTDFNFTSSRTAIDKMVSSTTPETLDTLLLSNALITCVHQLSHIPSVMIWLLHVLAAHPCPITVHSCYENIIGMLHQFQVKPLTKKKDWYLPQFLTPLVLLKIFVNLGAELQELLGRHHNIPQEEISKYEAMAHRKSVESQGNVKGQVCRENLGMLFKVLTTVLRLGQVTCKEDLNHIFFMLAKVELDTHISGNISIEAQECFSSILQCYSEDDWPSVVPDLCSQLQDVTDHHHNQVHLADILPGTQRGSFLKVRFSYVCLKVLLLPSQPTVQSAEILHFKLADIVNIGSSGERPVKLATALQALIKRDAYKMLSAMKLLDLCVGDSLYVNNQPTRSLEALINQANDVIQTIKDSSMDSSSQIKNALSKLKIKWSFSVREHQSNQHRSILPGISHSIREVMRQEVLHNNSSLLGDDLEMEL